MKKFKEGIKLLRFNLSSIILFEIMHKILSIAILAPLVYSILNFSIDLAGVDYLYNNTVNLYFACPSTYACFFVILLVIAIFFLVNICGIIWAMELSKREEKTNPLTLLIRGIYNALRIIRPKNMGIILYVLVILPVTFSVMVSGSMFSIKLPEFFRRFMALNDRLIAMVLIIYGIVCLTAVFRIFSLNYFTVYGFRFKESLALSKKVMKKRSLSVYLGVIFLNVALIVIMFLLETVFSLAAAGVLSGFIKSKAVSFAIDIVAEVIFFGVYITFSVVSTPLIYSYICACFYRNEADCDYDDVVKEMEERLEIIDAKRDNQKSDKRNAIAYGAIVVAGILLNGFYIYLSMTDKVNLDIYYSNRASVTAHRGDSYHAPENTMAAIMLAEENQADIVEIDVRQTKDGVLVLIHDESLLRTTGVDKNVGDVTYEYIKGLDASFEMMADYNLSNTDGKLEDSSNFAYVGEKIPTLEEAIIYAKEHDLFYNIELKPEDYYDGYYEKLVAMLEEYDFIDSCVVASLEYDAIKTVKNMNPDIKTVYIMSVVYGNFHDMEYADAYSVRHNFVDKDLVKKIHDFDKEIYVWTVNDPYKIKNLLLLDVDSIITDKPYETKVVIYTANETIFTDWLGRLIEEY